MSEYGSELLSAELLAQGESLVYKVGDVVLKIYPYINIDKLKRYQQVTDKVAKALDGQTINFDTSKGVSTFQWLVNPIVDVVVPQEDILILNNPYLLLKEAIQNPSTPNLRVRYPYTVSPYIYGPTMEDIFQGTTSEYAAVFNPQDALNRRLFDTALRNLNRELNNRYGFDCVGLVERNIKPLPNNQLCITDITNTVRLVR